MTENCPHCQTDEQDDRPTHCDTCGAFLPEVAGR
jgi:hypothetical protein